MYVGIRLTSDCWGLQIYFTAACTWLQRSLDRTMLFPVSLERTDTQQMWHSTLVSIGEVRFIYNQAGIVCKRMPVSQTSGLDGGELPIW